MTDVLKDLSEAVAELGRSAVGAVVGVGRAGSGLVVEDGVVVTNAHNLFVGGGRAQGKIGGMWAWGEGAGWQKHHAGWHEHGPHEHGGRGGRRGPGGDEGQWVAVVFDDGRAEQATVAGVDVDGDLAVLAVDTAGVRPLRWAEFLEHPPRSESGTSPVGSPRPGDLVIAVANPGGRGARVSMGTIAAVDVAFRGPRGGRITGAFEHTAPLGRGSSGGPVLDASGKVLGINTHRIGDGFYLAVTVSDALRQRIDKLQRGETPTRPRLGVAIAPLHVARRLRRSVGLPDRAGLLVQAVEKGAPAHNAGIRQGDLIVSIGEVEVSTVDELADALGSAPASGTVTVGIVRGVEELSVEVDLISSSGPTSDGQADDAEPGE